MISVAVSYPVNIRCELIVDFIFISLITSQNEPRFNIYSLLAFVFMLIANLYSFPTFHVLEFIGAFYVF